MAWLGFENVTVTTLVITGVTFWIAVAFFKREKNAPPGPWGIPVFGVLPRLAYRAWSVGPRRAFQELYHRFGPIYSMKLGSANVVILNDFQSVKDMLTHPEIQDRIKFDISIGRPGVGLVESSGRVWQEQRKFIQHHFRDFGIGKASFEDRVATEANFLTEAILKFEGRTLDLSHLLNNATSNVISSVSFGRRFDYDDETFQKVLRKLNENVETGALAMSLSAFLPFTKYLPFGSGKALSDNLATYSRFHNAIVDDHKATLASDDAKDAMDAYLLEIQNKRDSDADLAQFFNEDNMFWTIGDLFAAGTESTSTTLGWMFVFLLNNPDCEKKLRAQLDEVVGRNRLPRYSDRHDLPYLEAVISEVLRLGTAAILSLPHVAASDITFHGFRIPKGSIVIPNFHSLFSEPSKWKDPERFWPERFLDDDGKFIKREDFIPFSAGRRVCLGEQLARMELVIFISYILQKIRFSVPDGQTMPSVKGKEGIVYKPQPYEVFVTRCDEE